MKRLTRKKGNGMEKEEKEEEEDLLVRTTFMLTLE